MSNLIITVKAKIQLSLSSTSASFVREELKSVNRSIPYTNGTGQQLKAGQVLFEQGTVNTYGHHKVEVAADATLTDSGTFEIKITAYPSPTETAKTITAKIDGQNLSISVVYNSVPVTSDITAETPNRTILPLTANHFTSATSDYDNDSITAVSLSGDLTGFKYGTQSTDYSTLPADSNGNRWVSISDLASGKLMYKPNDVNNVYQKVVTYKVKDFNNNISK